MIKILFRKNGFIISFEKYDFEFFIYLLLRGLQFIFDILLPNIFMIILWRVYRLNFLMSTTYSIIFFISFQLLGIFIFKNKSIGMAIARLETIQKNGFFSSRSNSFYRAIFSLFYILPFLGILILLPSFVAFIFTKGVSLIDLITKSQIVPKYKAIHFNKILKNIQGG